MKKITLLFAYLMMTYCLAAQNQPPVAANDNITTITGNKLLDEVISNDFDPEDDTLTAALLIDVSNGTITRFCANGSFCYIPDSGFVGIDSFDYEITDEFSNTDTATVFLDVILPDSITFSERIHCCTSTIWPCRGRGAFFRRDPCEIPLNPLILGANTGDEFGIQSESELKNSSLVAEDSCIIQIISVPSNGDIYLSSPDSSNVQADHPEVNGKFYYEPSIIGITADTFEILKCDFSVSGAYSCDSIEVSISITYDPTCDYTTIEKYCCVPTDSSVALDVLVNDLEVINSIFPEPEYTVSGVTIADILTQPDNGSIIINGTADGLIYDAGGFSGIDSLEYQTQFTVMDNATGQMITFLSSPQSVYIIADDNCTISAAPIAQFVTAGSTLCMPPTQFLNVTSQFSAFCPSGLGCTNIPNYTFIPPATPTGQVCIPIPEDCPPDITIIVCETEYPDECVEVVIPLIYPDKVPTLSEWGLIILALLILIIGTVAIKTEQQRAFEPLS